MVFTPPSNKISFFLGMNEAALARIREGECEIHNTSFLSFLSFFYQKNLFDPRSTGKTFNGNFLELVSCNSLTLPFFGADSVYCVLVQVLV